ncbi:hypothetical protein FOXYSP1_20784 [Fusarium oxysporum f. sp. phaseoli]
MNHAFSDKALRSCEPFIHSNIDRWIELLDQEIREKKWSGSLNMARWADHLVFDTLLYQLPRVSGPDTRFDGPCPLVLGPDTRNHGPCTPRTPVTTDQMV